MRSSTVGNAIWVLNLHGRVMRKRSCPLVSDKLKTCLEMELFSCLFVVIDVFCFVLFCCIVFWTRAGTVFLLSVPRSYDILPHHVWAGS